MRARLPPASDDPNAPDVTKYLAATESHVAAFLRPDLPDDGGASQPPP